MELNELLSVMDRAAANLARLEAVWARAEPLLPDGPVWNTNSPEFDDLVRSWSDLLKGLPPIEGWTITTPLPDAADIGRQFIDYSDIGETPFSIYEELATPARELAEYRYRLNKARRQATQRRLEELTALMDSTLPRLIAGVARDSQEPLASEHDSDVASVALAVTELERLLGDTVERKGRWSDFYRHQHFGQGHDWHDIAEMDWPSMKADVQAAGFADESEPLPVPDIDLGAAAAAQPTGGATTELAWSRLTPDRFERLLFDLLNVLPGFQNVLWLTHTSAPDRGRDISAERVVPDGTGGTRTERVIVQAKHWLSKPVSIAEMSTNVAQMDLWRPPVVHSLIIATSGRFATDGVGWMEQHNEKGQMPFLQLWPDNQLERLLSSHPALVAGYGLRD